MIYSQSFCRVYQARGNSQSLYITVTDYTSVRMNGQMLMSAVLFN
jgi:hypothetical protein